MLLRVRKLGEVVTQSPPSLKLASFKSEMSSETRKMSGTNAREGSLRDKLPGRGSKLGGKLWAAEKNRQAVWAPSLP